MTASSLRSQSCKELAQMARSVGLPGWHSMRKDELVRALINHARRKPRRANGSDIVAHSNGGSGAQAARAKSHEKLRQLHNRLTELRQISSPVVPDEKRDVQDRLVVMVRDPYWLHAYWELAPRSIDRAQAAMGQRWHGAQPVLRVLRMQPDAAALHERDIPIHGGVRNWYVDVQNPPADYRLEIGYLAEDGSFYCLARSNEVSTPPAGTSDAVDENWKAVAEDADRIFAMSGGYSAQGASRELQ